MSDISTLFLFFKNNGETQYTLKDIYAEFPDMKQASIRRNIQQIIREGLLVRESAGHFAINRDDFYRKILKIGASCGSKFRLIFAVTFEQNNENREGYLLKAIENDYPNCIAINYDYRDLYIKDNDVQFGYASEKWTESFKKSETWKNIRTGEEKI